MLSNFVEELRWRGMLHDVMPDTESYLLQQMRSAYIGFDPTADSLHIGNLVPIMLLAHFQRAGHKPFALVGGATGMIGDPSGKSSERNLLDETALRHNEQCIKNQLSCFLDFDENKSNAAVLVNNYDWMKDFSFLEFIRDVGKHITVNYMMAKDSVKNRISAESTEGMSFTEFTYQLVQGYDFLALYKQHNCTLQMGGSDQWGNITTGTELIRRVAQGKGYALTCPLLTKSDGSKFGKSEGGNIWLDPKKTTPYQFYKFWLNTSDEDAERFIKIFTFLEKQQIETAIEEHKKDQGARKLQKKLAEELTLLVHSKKELENAITASNILFGKSTTEDLKALDTETFLAVFSGVPKVTLEKTLFDKEGLSIIGALSTETKFLKSNGDARRSLKENAISVNKQKVKEDYFISEKDFINRQFVLLQRGKKNYFLIRIQE